MVPNMALCGHSGHSGVLRAGRLLLIPPTCATNKLSKGGWPTKLTLPLYFTTVLRYLRVVHGMRVVCVRRMRSYELLIMM